MESCVIQGSGELSPFRPCRVFSFVDTPADVFYFLRINSVVRFRSWECDIFHPICFWSGLIFPALSVWLRNRVGGGIFQGGRTFLVRLIISDCVKIFLGRLGQMDQDFKVKLQETVTRSPKTKGMVSSTWVCTFLILVLCCNQSNLEKNPFEFFKVFFFFFDVELIMLCCRRSFWKDYSTAGNGNIWDEVQAWSGKITKRKGFFHIYL